MAWNDINVGSNDGNKKSDVEYMKLQAGTPVKFRILDAEPFSRWTHWLPKQSRSITCGGGDCPICAVIKAQKANGETPQYSSTKKHILHVWNYATGKVEFFEAGNTVFAQLGAYHKMLGDIRNVEFTVVKNGSGKQTSYTFMPGVQAPATQDIINTYNEKKVDFVARYNPPKVDDVKKLMAGMSFDEVFSKDNKEETTVTTEQDNDTVDFTV